MSPRRDVSMNAAEVRSFLDPPRNAVLTTLDRDGWPHSVAMWFVPRDDELAMWTYAKSQKAVNVRRDPRSTVLVEDGRTYDELRGVLVRGRARLITTFDDVFAIGRELYERYTFPLTGIAFESGPHVEVERQAHKRVGVAIPLERIASWDHRKLSSS